MRFFRAGILVTAAAALPVLSSVAVALPTSVVCPPALNAVAGSSGDDALAGTAAADCLVGEDGDDRLRGGAGDDRIAVRDGERDVVNCGPGIDRAILDFKDVLEDNSCEVVTRHRPSRNDSKTEDQNDS